MENHVKNLFIIKPYGFCFGINTLINKVDKYKKENPDNNLYFYKMLVHDENTNNQILKMVDGKLYENKYKQNSTIIFPAHGTLSTIKHDFDTNNIPYIDCICPILIKTKEEILKQLKENDYVLFFGKGNHDETIFFANEIKELKVIDTKDYQNIDFSYLKNKKFALFCQSTISINQYEQFKKYLKVNKFNPSKIYPICASCLSRWNKLDNIKQDLNNIFIVLGSNKSSNATEFYNKCKQTFPSNTKLFLDSIENIKENINTISQYENIYLMSATSFSTFEFENIIKYLQKELDIDNINNI